MRGQHVQLRGASLYVERVGDPAAPAVLLVMGAMASGVWWPEALCEALAARGRHVIRYDHRDTGRSTAWPPGAPGYTVDDLAWDAVGILDALGVSRAPRRARRLEAGHARGRGARAPPGRLAGHPRRHRAAYVLTD